MSETTPQPGNGTAQTVTTQPTLPDDLLAKVIAESERVFTARSARPSPIHLKNWEEIEKFAERAAGSGMVPKDYINKPAAICVAVMMGAELGISPMQSLINISVINGRPAVWGDAMLGLVQASGHLKDIAETITGDGDNRVATCVVWRVGRPHPVTQTFSVAQARTANLWGNNVWKLYPDRMLQMRARGFGLRDGFPDVLRGLITIEEARDIPPIVTDEPIKPASDSVQQRMMDNFDRGEAQRKAEAPKEPAPSAESEWVRATVAALQATDGWQYQRTLIAAIENAPSREDVLALGDKPGVQQTIANAPQKNRDFMHAAFADALTKFDRAAEAEEARKWEQAEAREPFPPGLQDKDLRDQPAP